MRISAVRKEDRGTYYCVAENGVGRGARRNINLEIEFAPVITAPRPRLGQALQYDMDLECHVEAYPPPGITWHKEGVQLSNNQHYSISQYATADEYTDTTLRVITIENRQYGEYVCRAANKLGTAETRVELFGKYFLHCKMLVFYNFLGILLFLPFQACNYFKVSFYKCTRTSYLR